jgi:hypothetical protein
LAYLPPPGLSAFIEQRDEELQEEPNPQCRIPLAGMAEYQISGLLNIGCVGEPDHFLDVEFVHRHVLRCDDQQERPHLPSSAARVEPLDKHTQGVLGGQAADRGPLLVRVVHYAHQGTSAVRVDLNGGGVCIPLVVRHRVG